MIVLIKRCKAVIRYNYIKIVTELIRILIFYDGYDTDNNSCSDALYDTSPNGRKVVDSIIVSIKKCMNLLKDIDSSIWDNVINSIQSNNSEGQDCQQQKISVVNIIKKFIL